MRFFKNKSELKKKFFWAIAILILTYLVLRLLNLTILPVFADEAIYIRWSQLIISDWKRYLFFPLNDGKTPLQMWLMIPLLKVFANQLFAGRLLSVLFGLGQVLMMIKLMSLFTKNRWQQILAAAITLFTPGLILTGRLALIDTQLTFFLTVSFYFAYQSLLNLGKPKLQLKQFICQTIFNANVLWAGVFLGLALLTKFSAILFLPVLATLLFYFWPTKKNQFWSYLATMTTTLIAIAIIGGCCFLLLMISPAFPQLFARGGDFLFSLSDFFQQPGTIISRNFVLISEMLATYLTNILFFSSIVLAIYLWPHDRRPIWLIVSGLAFVVPIVILGKIIYARYLLSALPFFILSFTLSLNYFNLTRTLRTIKNILLILFFLNGIYFTWANIFAPEKMILPASDQTQYLGEWSSGHGIEETIAFIDLLREQGEVLVLTEGYFGTLPDALLMEYFNRDVSGLRIEGIGQPVNDVVKHQNLIDQYPQAILIVNSHRMQVPLSSDKLLAQFERPIAGAPSLQIWNLK
ncbi:MAG: phospholipid carrier-dependent glycosyltransferase [bacterium]|nr:phospholipid carrier-dependent glycosyltransferase [bacterium]